MGSIVSDKNTRGSLMRQSAQGRLVKYSTLLYLFFLGMFFLFIFPRYRMLGSATRVLSPLAAVYFGLSASLGPLWVGILVFVRLVVRIFLRGSWGSLLVLSNGLPTLVGVYAQRYQVLVPLIVGLGSFAFLMHPVGWAAAWYTILWVIPLIAMYMHTSWSNMLIASFCSHVVGSLIWLYGGFLGSPDCWIALIPVVLVERCLIAFVAGLIDFLARAFWGRPYTQNSNVKLLDNMG